MKNIVSKPKIYPTRYPEVFRLEVAEEVFLVSKKGVSIRKEIICHKEYTRVKLDKGVAMHLDFKGTYIVLDKLLEVEAVCKTSFGPLGDRLILIAWYDDKIIGDFTAMRSYMGGGMNGKWPIIKTNNETILFTLSTTGMFGSVNELSIEYYQTLVPDHTIPQESNRPKFVETSEIPSEYLKDDFNIEEIEHHKQIEWLIPIRDKIDNKIGVLSCCYFPGFERYRQVQHGKWDLRKYPEILNIGRSQSSEFYAVQFSSSETNEWLFPWKQTIVSHKTE